MGKDVKKSAGKFDWVDDFISEMKREMRRSSVVVHKQVVALEKSLARKASGEVLSWLSDDGQTIHLTDGKGFTLEFETSRKFYKLMYKQAGAGDVDEAEVEKALGMPDHRETRRDNERNNAGKRERRLRQRIEHFDELITRPSKTGKGRLRVRLKYPPL